LQASEEKCCNIELHFCCRWSKTNEIQIHSWSALKIDRERKMIIEFILIDIFSCLKCRVVEILSMNSKITSLFFFVEIHMMYC
jgi:hypothetical protein